MKLLKTAVLFVFLVPLALLAIALVAVFSMDPNRLRPMLESAAQDRQIDLDISGDLGWQIYPRLGVSLGEVSARNLAGQPLARLGAARVQLRLLPLLQRRFEVAGFTVSAATLFYHVEEHGNSNWAPVLQSINSEPPNETTTGEPDSGLPSLEIQRISLENLTLDYFDAGTGQRASLRDINLLVTSFSLDKQPFDLQLNMKAALADFPEVAMALDASVVLDLSNSQLGIDEARLQLSSGIQQAALVITNKSQWGETFSTQGTLTLQPTSLRGWLNALGLELPPMANANALSRLAWQSDYRYTDQAFIANEIQLTLDDIKFNGSVAVTDFAHPKVKTQWLGSAILLDGYLPPAHENLPADDAAEQAAPLPLAGLRGFDLDARFALQSLAYQDLLFSQPTLQLDSTDGLVQLRELSTQMADGQVAGRGVFDARTDTATLAMEINATALHLDKLLGTLASFDKLSGQLNGVAQLRSEGSTADELIAQLQIDARAESETLQLKPINIERAYCQAVALLQQQKLPEFDWPKVTRLEPVTLGLELRGSKVTLTNMDAKIAKLVANARGTFDTASGQFNFPLSLAPGGIGGDIKGCLPVPAKWRERTLPIRCKGALDDISASTCLPDTELLTALLKEQVEAKLDAEKARAKAKIDAERARAEAKLEKEQDRAEAQLKAKAQELLDKNVKEEDKEAVTDKLKSLLKDLKK